MGKIILTIVALIVAAAFIDNEHMAAALLMAVIPLAALLTALGFMVEQLQALKMAKREYMRSKRPKHQEMIEDHQRSIVLLVFALAVPAHMLYAIFSMTLSRMGVF